ncbi:TonB-dependent receptor domain-containing protein [Sphingomonas alpina]|uniref:TonB-dependent receptor n=1 Tax=Sphingomonas alpina TaxID=653931 RepID=A0A7H0LMM8_9SPHN|nr:TonB-dependent receptor [Sphingomonas alpina]QNQ10931.1 TonB-dependent receptor [Sphingomonas alpina]
MAKPIAYGTLLLLTSSLIAPGAIAQTSGTQAATPPETAAATPSDASQDPAAEQEQIEVSTPGADDVGDIVVIGRNIPNAIRATPQVVSVLSSADIARTGEGDIAGALQRVTGLSVVGNGFVFVRGLGDRYSSSMLNGSPLPSPEPLRRTVPLDIFPTSIIASALVQKSYSVNYPAEFGGGVINLTTKAVPEESFLEFGASATYNSTSTDQLGYVYDGGSLDWLGFDSGERTVPGFIKAGGSTEPQFSSAQIMTMSNAPTTLLQQNDHLPPNFSGEINLGHSFDVGSTRIGLIASGSVSNGFRTRDAVQQDTIDAEGALRSDYRTVLTDNRIVANGLIGIGADFGEQRVRWTNLYIHDTLKQGRLSTATLYPNSSGDRIMQQNTNWFERQLIDSQLVGEFKFGDVSLDVRGSYANTKRNSPYERSFSYRYDQNAKAYQNTLNGLGESAYVAFSSLNEDLWSGQADLGYKLPTARPIKLSAGYYYSDSDRTSTRYNYQYRTFDGSALPAPSRFLRPDYLLSINSVVNGCVANDGGGCIRLFNLSGSDGAAAYAASLRIHAGYVQLEGEILDGVRATLGVRYEKALEEVTTNSLSFQGASLDNDYFLPAATVTWNFAPDMQFRVHGSKTIARPQFRELAPQLYRDFDSDRQFFGNPKLVDSQLTNAEARYEWFFGRDQRITAAAFYKHIKNPIEQVGFYPNDTSALQTGFSYAPSADLYGGEIEAQKYFDLAGLGGFFSDRRLLVVANYTYTQSKIKSGTELVPSPIQNGNGVALLVPANQLFVNGAPLTGQSDHLVNAQLAIEKKDSLSQLTLLFSYASKRVTNRGPVSGGFLPDIVEQPGIKLDLVGRQGIRFGDAEFELKLEARNLTGTKFQEFQTFANGSRVDVNTYRLGRTFTIGISAKL